MAAKTTATEAKPAKLPDIKRACLGGTDIVKLLKGEVLRAYGIEFVYDGSDERTVQEAADSLARRR